MYSLVNQVSCSEANVNLCHNNSWIKVDNNADRTLYAQAAYVTNLDDLKINVQSPNIKIGSVKLEGSDGGLMADVVPVGPGSGALRVISQDLESSEDDITIGDREGNFASVNSSLSALNVYITNPCFTKCETRTFGTPTFVSKQILIYNNNNTTANVSLTLSSGMNCEIPIGSSGYNNTLKLNLEVVEVNDYSGCTINFFA
jgi:hypothetical protein